MQFKKNLVALGTLVLSMVPSGFAQVQDSSPALPSDAPVNESTVNETGLNLEQLNQIQKEIKEPSPEVPKTTSPQQRVLKALEAATKAEEPAVVNDRGTYFVAGAGASLGVSTAQGFVVPLTIQARGQLKLSDSKIEQSGKRKVRQVITTEEVIEVDGKEIIKNKDGSTSTRDLTQKQKVAPATHVVESEEDLSKNVRQRLFLRGELDGKVALQAAGVSGGGVTKISFQHDFTFMNGAVGLAYGAGLSARESHNPVGPKYGHITAGPELRLAVLDGRAAFTAKFQVGEVHSAVLNQFGFVAGARVDADLVKNCAVNTECWRAFVEYDFIRMPLVNENIHRAATGMSIPLHPKLGLNVGVNVTDQKSVENPTNNIKRLDVVPTVGVVGSFDVYDLIKKGERVRAAVLGADETEGLPEQESAK